MEEAGGLPHVLDRVAPSFQVGTKWMGMPHSIVGNAIAYRKSWFKEIGLDIEIQLLEFGTVIANGSAGEFQMIALDWTTAEICG